MTGGVFLTDREIFEKKMWQNVLDFRLFFFLYGNAVWKEEGVQVGSAFVKRGQFLRSYRQLQDDLAYIENHRLKKYPLPSLKRAVDRLLSSQRCKVDITEHGTLFTILNYQYYQGFERFYPVEPVTGLGTVGEQYANNKKQDIKGINDSSPPPSGKEGKEYKFSPEHLAAAQLLRDKIMARKPDIKFTGKLETWADEVRLMVERDHRSIDRICAVIEWCQQDSFWRDNVLSIATVRKQFDRLELKMGAGSTGKREPSTEDILRGFDSLN